jgi:hypothetical protein
MSDFSHHKKVHAVVNLTLLGQKKPRILWNRAGYASCLATALVEPTPDQSSFRAVARLGTALLLLALPSSSSALTWGIDLTQLTLKELLEVEIIPHVSVRRADATVAAIRAGCSDGLNICDALREVLATAKPIESGPRGEVTRVSSTSSNLAASDDTQEYNRPTVRRAMYATPSDMGFGRVPTVDGAMRAFGFGSSR